VRFRALQQFFSWLVNEEEIEVSPMAKLRPPRIPEQLTPVLDDAAIRALLKACAGKDFRADEPRLRPPEGAAAARRHSANPRPDGARSGSTFTRSETVVLGRSAFNHRAGSR
jgi:hypothetical protein